MTLLGLVVTLSFLWAIVVTLKSCVVIVIEPAPHKPTPLAEIDWQRTCGYKFDDTPAEPATPMIDPNNPFTRYDAKVAAANPDDYNPPPFSAN